MTPTKVAMYWHNGRSLGHTSASARVAELILRDRNRVVSLAGITGAFRGLDLLPEGLDLIKLPSFTNRDDADGWRLTPRLWIDESDFTRLRRELVNSVMRAFRPDLLLADHIPRGREDELVDAVEGRMAGVNVLTLRGVLFDSAKTNRKYFTGERGRWIEQHYDNFMVHAPREVFDLAEHYDISPSIQRRMRYTGYLTELDTRTKDAVRCTLGVDPSSVLCVCAMGGGQGAREIWTCIVPALQRVKELGHILVVTGPYLEPETLRWLMEEAQRDMRLAVRSYSPDLRDWMRASDLFIGAAGANMIAELLAADANTVLVPRQTMEVEQAMHSRRLEERGLARRLTIAQMKAGLADTVIRSAIAEPLRPGAGSLLWSGGPYLDHILDGGE